VTSRLGTGISKSLFYGVGSQIPVAEKKIFERCVVETGNKNIISHPSCYTTKHFLPWVHDFNVFYTYNIRNRTDLLSRLCLHCVRCIILYELIFLCYVLN
jgi:hypothetical protein